MKDSSYKGMSILQLNECTERANNG